MTKYLLFFVFLLVSILGYAQPNDNSTANRLPLDSLRHQIEHIAQSVPGRVGVSARIVETGESVDWQGDEPFPMQSVYKFPIGMAVLHQIDEGKLTLNQTVHVEPKEYVSERQHSPIRDKYPTGTDVSVGELLRYSVSESDGSASDVLMRLAGGPSKIMTYLKTLGIRNIIVANTEKEIGSDQTIQYRNWAKPNEAVALLALLQKGRGLSVSSRSYLLRLMTDTETGLNRLKGQLPAGTVVAHKTGTSSTVDGVTAATNDIGLITLPNNRHLAIAVFVSDSKADVSTREAVIARLAKVIWDAWKR